MKIKKTRKDLAESNQGELESAPIDILRVFNSVPIPIAIYNDLDKSIKLNKKFTEIFGYTEVDIKKVDDWWNLCIPDENIREELKTEWNGRFKNSLKNKIDFEPMEVEVHCKKGARKYIRYNLEVIDHFYVGFFVDITEWKQVMEQKLLVSERRTNSLLYAPQTISMAIFDKNGVILEINDAAIRETKIGAEKLIGKNAFLLLEKYGIKNIYKFDEVIKNKKAINIRVEFLNSKYDVEYYPLLNENEQVERVALYARNLSDLFLKEKLQVTETRFKAFMEHGPFLAYIKDKSGRYIYGNPAVHKFIKNYADDEFIGSTVGNFFSEKTTEEMIKYDKEIIEKKKPIVIPPHSHIDKDGNISWLKEVKFPIPVSQDEILIGGIVLFVDDEIQLSKKLEESERKARILLDAPTDPIILLDRSGKIFDINSVTAENLHTTREEAIGKNLIDMIPSNSDASHSKRRISLFSEIIENKEPIEFVNSYLDQEFQIKMFPIFDIQGEVEWIALFMHDITKLKENEKKLQLSQFSMDNSSIPIMIFTQDGSMIYANDTACETLGYEKYEMLLLNAWDISPNVTTKAEFNDTIPEITSNTKLERESRIIKKDGSEFTALVTINPLELRGELYVVAYLQDITLLKLQKDELNKLFNATEQSPISVVITDLKGNIEYVNSKFCKLTEYSQDELIGRNPRILKTGYTTTQEYKNLWNTISNGEVWQGTFRNVKKNGEFFWEHATISPIFGSNKKIQYYLGLKEDITEKLTLQEQLQHSQKMEAMGRLAGSISHDFNNILTVIMGTAQLLQYYDQIDDSVKDSLLEIIKASNRAAGLTKQLLAFSKKQVLKPKLLDLNQILLEMENMIRRILPENIKLNLELQEHRPITVKVDKVQLEQVVLNLVINAKEAMPNGGELSISTFVNSKHIGNQLDYFGCLSIADTGTGMDDKTKSRLFEPFFTTKSKGTGLGLATVYGIISQSNGNIDVQSELKKGSKFIINFPLKLKAVLETQKQGIKKSEWKSKGETILLIEDEDAVRSVIKKILINEGYSVWEAENGESALLNYSHLVNKIDLVISDVIMPVMGGVEALTKFREIRADINILYISGYIGDENGNVVGKEEEFLSKPIERLRLLKKIREILD